MASGCCTGEHTLRIVGCMSSPSGQPDMMHHVVRNHTRSAYRPDCPLTVARAAFGFQKGGLCLLESSRCAGDHWSHCTQGHPAECHCRTGGSCSTFPLGETSSGATDCCIAHQPKAVCSNLPVLHDQCVHLRHWCYLPVL